MISTALALAATLVMAALLVACNGDEPDPPPAPVAPVATPAPAPEPAPEPEPEPAPEPAPTVTQPEPAPEPEPEPEPEATPEPPAEPEAPAPAIELEIGAEELFGEFFADKDAALAKYGGMTARISGMIRENFPMGRGGFLMVVGGDYANGVICILGAEDYEAEKNRQPGEPITITGTIFDYVYDVTVENCQIEA